MKYLRSLVVGAALGLVAGSCSSREEAELPPKDTFPEIAQHFEPSDAGIAEMMRALPDAETWAKLSFAAGYFACSQSDILVTDVGGGQYTVEFAFGPALASEDQVKFATNLHDILDDYVELTGDEGYETWYPAFVSVHDVISSNVVEYCKPVPVGESETF